MLDASSQADPSLSAPLLSAVSISKRYGDFLANDSIDLDLYPGRNPCAARRERRRQVDPGEDHVWPDPAERGELRWMGENRSVRPLRGARARHRHGVSAFLAVRESHCRRERRARPDADQAFAAMSARLARSRAIYGLPLDPKREVWRLSVGERQRIEIVRALMQNPKLLILDEPTAVLTPQEADQLFVVLERLKSEGRAILYISHKLDEVKRLCDTRRSCAPARRSRPAIRAGKPRLARAHDGRRRHRRGEAAARRDHDQAPRLLIKDLSIEPDDPHGVAASSEVCSKSAAAKSLASPASPAMARTNCSPRFRASACRRARQHRASTARPRANSGQRAPRARRGFRPGRTARPRHRAAHEAVRERAAHRRTPRAAW